jgi:hypothetical protein
MNGPNARREAFTGVAESLEALSERDLPVHLSLIKMESGFVIVWLDRTETPLAIIITK